MTLGIEVYCFVDNILSRLLLFYIPIQVPSGAIIHAFVITGRLIAWMA